MTMRFGFVLMLVVGSNAWAEGSRVNENQSSPCMPCEIRAQQERMQKQGIQQQNQVNPNATQDATKKAEG